MSVPVIFYSTGFSASGILAIGAVVGGRRRPRRAAACAGRVGAKKSFWGLGYMKALGLLLCLVGGKRDLEPRRPKGPLAKPVTSPGPNAYPGLSSVALR